MSFYGDVFLPNDRYILSKHTQGTIFIGTGQQSVSINNLVTNNISVTSLIYGDSVFGTVTVGTTLSVLGDARIRNLRPFNDALDDPNDPTQSLRVSGKVINIGVPDSLVYINGTTTYMFMTQQNVNDPKWILNAQYPVPFQYGNDCGIQINSISGPGYIKTNDDGTQFLIKAPQSNTIGYISMQDTSNNMTVSGTSFLNNVKIASNLLVSGLTTLYDVGVNNMVATGNSIIHGNTTLGSNLSVKGEVMINRSLMTNGNITIASELTVWQNTKLQTNLEVGQNAFIKGNTTLGSRLEVVGNSSIKGNTTIGSNLNVSGLSFFNGNVLANSNFIALGNSVFESPALFKSSMVVNDNSTYYGPVAINNKLFVARPSEFTGITNVSYLNVSGNSLLSKVMIKGNTSLLSDLMVSGNTYLNYLSVNTIDNVEQAILSKAEAIVLNDYYTKTDVNTFNYLPRDEAVVTYATLTDISVFQVSPTTFTDLMINNALNVSGVTNILGDFNVTGQSNFQILTTNYFNAYRQSTLYGPTLISNCLNVCGTTSLHDTVIEGSLSVTGIIMIDNVVTMNNELIVNNNTTMQTATIGYLTLNDGCDINGPLNINSNLVVMNDSTFNIINVDSINVTNDTIVNNINVANLYSSGITVLTDANIMNSFNVNGEATFTSVLAVSLQVDNDTTLQNVIINGDNNINGNQVVVGTLNVDGETTLNNNLIVNNIIGPTTISGGLTSNGPFLTQMNFNVFSDSSISLIASNWINGVIGISHPDSTIITLPSASDINQMLNNPAPNTCFTTYISHQLGYNNTISLVANTYDDSTTTFYDGYGYSDPTTDTMIFNTGMIDPIGKYSYQFITRIDDSFSISIFKII